jgi:hypothetical protein
MTTFTTEAELRVILAPCVGDRPDAGDGRHFTAEITHGAVNSRRPIQSLSDTHVLFYRGYGGEGDKAALADIRRVVVRRVTGRETIGDPSIAVEWTLAEQVPA